MQVSEFRASVLETSPRPAASTATSTKQLSPHSSASCSGQSTRTRAACARSSARTLHAPATAPRCRRSATRTARNSCRLGGLQPRRVLGHRSRWVVNEGCICSPRERVSLLAEEMCCQARRVEAHMKVVSPSTSPAGLPNRCAMPVDAYQPCITAVQLPSRLLPVAHLPPHSLLRARLPRPLPSVSLA